MRTLQNISSEPKLWMRTTFLYALFILLAGCSESNSPRGVADDSPQANAGQEGSNPIQNSGTDPVDVNLPEDISPHRNFEYSFYEPQDCPADPIFNCSADLTLCEDGSSFILITDIINRGVYTETEATIVSSWDSGDAAREIVFMVQSDGTLTDDIYGFTWEPVIAGGFDGLCE